MEIKENVSLKDKNWFRTGGNAAFFCEPESVEDFQQALSFAQEKVQQIFFLGEGANILISDNGFNGLVIHPKNKNIEIINLNDEVNIKAGAGAQVQHLINFCLENNLMGLEEFSGIPGTVGGAVFINIHFFNFLLQDFLIRATVINKLTGEVEEVNKDWFEFGYDQSKLQKQEHYLIDATFKVQSVDEKNAAYAKGRSNEIIRYRNWRYPESNSCGSFFRNFLKDEIENVQIPQKHHPYIPEITETKKLVFVAYYLDRLGVKGELKIGKASVTYKHANMIVTEDGATSADVIAVAKRMQELMRDNFGLVPQPECQLIGFDEYPLLRG